MWSTLSRGQSDLLDLIHGRILDLLCLGVKSCYVLLVLDATNFLVSFHFFICRCYVLVLGSTSVNLEITPLMGFLGVRSTTCCPLTMLLLHGAI